MYHFTITCNQIGNNRRINKVEVIKLSVRFFFRLLLEFAGYHINLIYAFATTERPMVMKYLNRAVE